MPCTVKNQGTDFAENKKGAETKFRRRKQIRINPSALSAFDSKQWWNW
jgi:hypothetical protein